MLFIHSHEVIDMKNIINKEKGSVLITLIIVMTVTAALGRGWFILILFVTFELFSIRKHVLIIVEGGGRLSRC